jgi:hypothetical protein
MNSAAKAWVKDLRTTRAKQTRNTLHRVSDNRFCCLGRACVVYNRLHKNKLPVSHDCAYYSYAGEEDVLPKRVRVWLGLNTNAGHFGNESLAKLNDSGKTFKEIADIIESEPDGLFVKAAK